MIQTRREGDVAVITLERPPANAIELELVDRLSAALEECRFDDPVRGIVLTATHPRIFSSGLDLKALSDYDRPTLEHFLREYSDLLRTLFAFPKPVVAALNGHAIAGGYLLASTADRILVANGTATVGLTELRLAVPIPAPALELLGARLSGPRLEELVLDSTSHLVDKALAMGLVDKIVPPAELVAEAIKLATHLGNVPGHIYEVQKTRLRERVLRRAAAAEVELHDFVDAWYSPDSVIAREKVLESLKSK